MQTHFPNIAPKNLTCGTRTCRTSHSFITRQSIERSAPPHRLVLSQTPGDPRLVLGEDGLELNEKLYEVHSHAQVTMGKEQRRQREYFNRKVHGDPFNSSDLVWLFEPHRAKSRKFYLPLQGPYEVLNRTSEVTYKICKRGRPERQRSISTD